MWVTTWRSQTPWKIKEDSSGEMKWIYGLIVRSDEACFWPSEIHSRDPNNSSLFFKLENKEQVYYTIKPCLDYIRISNKEQTCTLQGHLTRWGCDPKPIALYVFVKITPYYKHMICYIIFILYWFYLTKYGLNTPLV